MLRIMLNRTNECAIYAGRGWREEEDTLQGYKVVGQKTSIYRKLMRYTSRLW